MNVPVVLCDDDALIRWAWTSRAEVAGVSLRVFASSEELLNALPQIATHAVIYLDSQLENGVSGVELAKTLHEKGYRNLVCTTGYADSKVKACPYFREVIEKNPPF